MIEVVLPKFNIIVAQPKAFDGGDYPFFVEKDYGQRRYKIHGDVNTILRRDGEILRMTKTTNLVTNDGDLYYAESPVRATQPTHFTTASTPFPFDGQLEMFKSVSVDPTKGANRSGMTSKAGPSSGTTTKSAASGFPKVNDTDGDNSGKGTDVLTYKFSYTAGDWSDAGTFDDCDVTNPSPGATEKMLMWAQGLAVVKSASDTLIVYLNHTFNG